MCDSAAPGRLKAGAPHELQSKALRTNGLRHFIGFWRVPFGGMRRFRLGCGVMIEELTKEEVERRVRELGAARN